MNELIRLKLISLGFDGLYEMLGQLVGLELGQRFTLREPLAVGGQSLLWTTDDATKSNKFVVTRMALLPYHRPAYIKGTKILRVRQRIEQEAKLLQQFKDSSLPNFYGLFHAGNPLQPPERGTSITETEPYLVMEFVAGLTVMEQARLLHTTKSAKNELSLLALNVTDSVIQLCNTLYQHGYLYSDLNPRNLICATSPSGSHVRVIDAGSIIPTVATPEIDIPYTWAYIPPDYYMAYDKGHQKWPNENFVIYTLGKTLWQVLTNRQPMPCERPDLADVTLFTYPKPLVELVIGLIEGHYQNFKELAVVFKKLQTDIVTIL